MDFSDNRDELASDKHKERFFAGVPNVPKKDKDGMAIYLLFIQHIIYSLAPKGKAAIVVPTGFLKAGSGIPKKIREYRTYFLSLKSPAVMKQPSLLEKVHMQ